jgi:hypothetical protein
MSAADSSVSKGSVFSFDGLSLESQRYSAVAIEAYLYATQIRLEPAFRRIDVSNANLLEELADKLDALIDC